MNLYWETDENYPYCTIKQALQTFCDITTPPTQKLLSYLATQATEKNDIEKLKKLASVSYFDKSI